MSGYLTISDNFESTTIGQGVGSPWNDGGNTLATVVGNGNDGTTPHSGTHQAQCSWTAGPVVTTFGVNLAAYYTDEFLWNAWYRFDSSISTTFEAGIHCYEFFDGGGGGSNWFLGNALDGGNNLFFQAQANGHASFSNKFPGNPSNTWHFIQYYYKKSTGTYKIWFDTTLQSGMPVTDFQNYQFDRFDFIANHSPALSSPPGYVYVDEVQIFTDSNSLGLGQAITSGSMAGGDAAASGGAPASYYYGNKSLR